MKNFHIIKEFRNNHGPSNVIISATQNDPLNCIVISLKNSTYNDNLRKILSPVDNSLTSQIKFIFILLIKLAFLERSTIYYHLIHSYLVGTFIFLFLGNRHHSVTVIHNVEDYFFKKTIHNRFARYIHYAAVSFTNTTLCVSGDLIKYSSKFDSSLIGRNTVIIYNGVNTAHFYQNYYYRRLVRNSLNIKLDDFVILMCGHLIKRKNFEFVLHNASLIYETLGRHFTIIILGEGVLEQPLKNISEKLTEYCNIIFCGFTNKPIFFYNACDLLIIPSLREGFGLVGIESLLCSTPVLAANVPGLSDVLSKCDNSYLYKCNNSGDFIKKFQIFLSDFYLTTKNSRKTFIVPDKYKSEFMSNRYLRLNLSMNE